ncbi:MAG TPA: GMC family oxidoreductase [Chitinophagaceae bacterium]|nr:GMC family oxidoreductase [Chitinophagaceae bacterium]
MNTYDAIVVGSGISGGWAAKELTEKGLKTLLLERGRDVKHGVDYPTANLDPWELPNHNILTQEDVNTYPIQRTVYHFGQDDKHFFVKDTEHVYDQVKPFWWIQGNQVGGKSLLWSRHTFRWSDLDFEANGKEGIGIDWPIRYKDVAPWYDYVERFIGVSGKNEGLPQLPDGQFIPPFEMNCMEVHLKKTIEEKFKERNLIQSRMAVLTQPHNGRGKCMSRNLCHRGCPYGAYFSSNSSTLPAAYKTGNLTLRPFSIVHNIIWDEQKHKATGVRVIDAETMETFEYFAPVIFLNASALNTTKIMMHSTSRTFPNGFANNSGVLGHYLMDHYSGPGIAAGYDILKDQYYFGQRSTSVYVPRYQNLNERDRKFTRGFAYEVYVSRADWTRGYYGAGAGGDWKDSLSAPGDWQAAMFAFGECLPDYKNQVRLDDTKKDKWGIPVLRIQMEYGQNELAMKDDMVNDAREMLGTSNPIWVADVSAPAVPGMTIHEMGTARMGDDPKTSVLNKHNQCHDAPNVFVTDGACMVSTACQNPSLTYMALTARACDYAVQQLKRGELK